MFKGTTLVSLKEAKLTCAERGGIVLPIKTKGMYRIIRQYSIAVNALDVFIGMNLTADVGRYTDNEIYDSSSAYDFEGESNKFAESPCVYLKRGITYKTRGISCEKTLEFYCLWKRKFFLFLFIFCSQEKYWFIIVGIQILGFKNALIWRHKYTTFIYMYI